MKEPADRADITSTAGATRVFLVAAVAANGIIGAGNRMPWHLPEDLKHFKALTLGHPVIMGRKTYESIGKPLPGRENVVISRTPGLEIPGVSVASSLQGALALCLGEPVAFVIGGGEIYKSALPLADGIVMTEIGIVFAGDTKFPDWDRAAFRESQRQSHTSATGVPYDFVLYEKLPA
jgi:dihydrofolate reductase